MTEGGVRLPPAGQGDRDGLKGVYIVNLVGEVTQYEYVGVVRLYATEYVDSKGKVRRKRLCSATIKMRT